MSPSTSSAPTRREKIRRHTPLKSVSTRIILCVFVSTLLTAVLVSWLSIGAIRRDVRSRFEERGFALIEEQSLELADRFSEEVSGGPTPDCVTRMIRPIETPSADYVLGCLSQSELLNAFQPSASGLSGMRMLVATANGRIVAAAGIRGQQRIGARIPVSHLQTAQALDMIHYEAPDGMRLVGVASPFARTAWILAVETEYATTFAPAVTITSQIFIVDVCIILLFSVLAYKITLAIMAPIEALSLGARKISEGHTQYQIPAPANSDDELGLLTQTFNEMMAKIRSSQLEIEQDRIRLAEKNEELQQANEILAQLSITDGLTKLHNHRYFQDHLIREIKRVGRTKAPLALILLDIDDFKLLNDSHGHAAGDEVLVSLASIMTDSARESDLIARYGGEEFVVLMPNTDLAGAVHLAEKIRMAVESTRLIIGDNMKPIEITISLGVAVFDGDRREFFGNADRALYQAKAAGKNCVIIAGTAPPLDDA
jgi:diguanylate cyclase (GGDEF)-like protein